MDILPLIIENRLILIPALIIIGWVCKHIQIIPDKFIPLILLALGIIFSLLIYSFGGYTRCIDRRGCRIGTSNTKTIEKGRVIITDIRQWNAGYPCCI